MKTFSLILAALALTIGCVDTEPGGDSWSFAEGPAEETTTERSDCPGTLSWSAELGGCVDPCADGGCQTEPEVSVPPPEPEPEPQPEPPEPERVDFAELDGAFVSGHLGTYDSCPEDGFSSTDNAMDGISDEAFCADLDGDGTSACGLAACEHGVAVVRVSNIGDLAALDIEVVSLELYDASDEWRADLPILEVVDLETAGPINGNLDSGAEGLLRITFQGPSNPYEYLIPADGDGIDYSGVIVITIDASNAESLTVRSSPLYPIPQVDT